MDVSIIIVNWNTKSTLRDCLKSIYQHTANLKFEIIVVDNASSDGSVNMVNKEFPHVELVLNSENIGYARANNKGIALARGRYLLILNSDTLFFMDAISNTLPFAEKHPEAAVIACRMLNADKTVQESTFMFPSLLNLFLQATFLNKLFHKNKFFGREKMTWWDWNETREVDVVTGCFMFVRKKAIDEVGVMDKDFFMYFEETDWCYRFKKAGWKIIFIPICEIIHLGSVSSKRIADKLFLQLYSSMLLYFKKHKGRLIYTLACLLVALFFFIRIPYWFFHSLFYRKSPYLRFQTAKIYTLGTFKALLGWKALSIHK